MQVVVVFVAIVKEPLMIVTVEIISAVDFAGLVRLGDRRRNSPIVAERISMKFTVR